MDQSCHMLAGCHGQIRVLSLCNESGKVCFMSHERRAVVTCTRKLLQMSSSRSAASTEQAMHMAVATGSTLSRCRR